MASLHLFGGEKGGCGKSFFCKACLQYHLDKNLPFVAFDTDRSNPDVRRCYHNVATCQVAVFSEGERYEDTANQIYNTALDQTVLVNLPAQVFIPVKNWITHNELLDIASEDGVTFFLWFISDGGYDSLKLFRQSITTLGDGIQHILVKNYGRCDDWEGLECDQETQNLLHHYQVPIVDFPKFIGSRDRNAIDAKSISFGEAKAWREFGSISRQRVKRFLRETYEALDDVGLFADAPPTKESDATS